MVAYAGGDAGHLPPYKSETKAFVSGQNLEFFDFVPLRGPKGGRVCIDRFEVCILGTITVGTATWDGRDVSRLIQNAVVEQRDGRQRWSLTGFKSRIAAIKYNSIERWIEHADIGVGAGAAVELRHIIPMSKRYARRPKDFALPADVFRKVIINCATAGNAATGTAVLSALALNVFVLAHWHEETSGEIHAEDVVKSVDFTSNTQARTALGGVVHDMDIVRETTTAGGGLVNGITDARCDDLGIGVLLYNDYKSTFREKRALGNTVAGTTGGERFRDPYADNQAMALITSTPETSLDDGKIVDSLKVDVGTGAANLALVTREVMDKSQANFNAQVAMFGIDPKQMSMKTAAKSKKSFGDWQGKDRAKRVMPWSFRLPMAG